MHIMVKLGVLCLISIISSQSYATQTVADSIYKDIVKVNVAKDLGRVVYDHSKSVKQFPKIDGKSVSKNTLGLTEAQLKIDGTTEVGTSKVPGGYLVFLSAVNMQLFYGDIIVYIDKKYPVGSCEYNAIIAHENKHVGIARLVIDFYTPYVKKEIEKIVSQIEPERTKNQTNADAINRKYNREIQSKLKPIMELIQDQLEIGNAKLDTPETYKKDTEKCSNW